MNWKRIGNVIAFAAILGAISWLLNWSTGSGWLPSLKAALNGVCLWMLGQLQNTGRIAISSEALGAFRK